MLSLTLFDNKTNFHQILKKYACTQNVFTCNKKSFEIFEIFFGLAIHFQYRVDFEMNAIILTAKKVFEVGFFWVFTKVRSNIIYENFMS